MADNFPISNIPLIFTQYRTRILEESGQQWFHADNECIPVSRVTDSFGSTPPKPYDYPDPWGTAICDSSTPSPALAENTSESIIESLEREVEQTAEFWVSENIAPDVTPVTSKLDLTPLGSQSSHAHPSQNVNLFPLGEAIETDAELGLYDLTEFDNGEIEVPPMAVRNAHQAKFEKVSPSQQVDTGTSSRSLKEDANREYPTVQNNPKPKPASAEIAKFRLRNCL